MATVTVGQLGPMRHSADLDPRLMPAVSAALDQAYGPGYSATLRSGAGNSVTGTQRHTQLPTGGQAGDWVIKDPAGNTLFGQALLPLAQVWTAKYGSIGVNARAGESGSNFTHLDLVGGLGRPLSKGEGPIWFYGGEPKGFKEAALSGAPASSRTAARTQLPEPDPFGVDKLNAAYASAPPLPNLRPAQNAIASLAAAGSAGAGSGPSVSGRRSANGRLGLLPPTPPMNLGSSQTRFPNLRPALPQAPKEIAAAQALVQAALTGDQAAITKAGNDLLGVAAMGGQKAQDAIKGYLGKVAAESPYGYVIADRLKSNPALAGQLPTFGGFKDKVVGGLTSMGPRPLFPGVDPMRDATTVQSLQHPISSPYSRTPVAATGNTYPSPPPRQGGTPTAGYSPEYAARQTMPSSAFQSAFNNAVPVDPRFAALSSMGNTAAPPSPVPFPLVARASAASGSGATFNAGPMTLRPQTPVPPPSYYSMATGNQRDLYIDPMQDAPTNPYASNPYPNLVPQMVPFIQQFARTVPFTQPARTVVGPIMAGTYNQPAYQVPRQTFSPPSGFLPTSAPAGGGYVSSPSTFGGVAYISGAGTAASPRIATNSAGKSIRLS